MHISMLTPKTLLAWLCTEDFQPCLHLLKQRGLLICSRLNSLEGEEGFLWCLHIAQGYSPFPGCTEDFKLF